LAPEVPQGPERDGPGGRDRAGAADAHAGAAAGAVLGVVRGFRQPRPGVPGPDESLPGLVAAVVREMRSLGSQIKKNSNSTADWLFLWAVGH
jgi:hypothetical protein